MSKTILYPLYTSPHFQRVKVFMQGAAQRLPKQPEDLSAAEAQLRVRLQLEEALEGADAAGTVVEAVNWRGERVQLNRPPDEPDGEWDHATWHFNCVDVFDIVAWVDFCCDSRVIATGSLIACGAADIELQRAVDENNLRKFAPGHTIRADGKLVKPPDHPDVKPELAEILRLQREGQYIVIR